LDSFWDGMSSLISCLKWPILVFFFEFFILIMYLNFVGPIFIRIFFLIP
jgi:type II secretory pathway component PulF